MRAVVVKHVHAFQRGMPGLNWTKAKFMWRQLMGRDVTNGQHPADTETPNQRRRRLKRLERPRKNRGGWMSCVGISTCAQHGVRRHGPYAKVSLRKLRSAWLKATLAGQISPNNPLLQQAREHFDTAIKAAMKGLSRLGRVFRRNQGRGS